MNQTYRNMEIICVDDCSTDGTIDVIRRLADEDSRIRLVQNEHNMGCTLTLNRLVSLAQGKYIARMDSDDVSLPTRIAKQAAFMEAHKDIALCGTQSYHIDESGNITGLTTLPVLPVFVWLSMIKNNCVYHPSSFGRAEVFKSNPYSVDCPCAQDYELWCRLMYGQGLKIANLSELLLKYRMHAAQASKARYDEQYNTAMRIMSTYRVGTAAASLSVFGAHTQHSEYDEECARFVISQLDELPMTKSIYKCYKDAVVHFMQAEDKAALRRLSAHRRFARIYKKRHNKQKKELKKELKQEAAKKRLTKADVKKAIHKARCRVTNKIKSALPVRVRHALGKVKRAIRRQR